MDDIESPQGRHHNGAKHGQLYYPVVQKPFESTPSIRSSVGSPVSVQTQFPFPTPVPGPQQQIPSVGGPGMYASSSSGPTHHYDSTAAPPHNVMSAANAPVAQISAHLPQTTSTIPLYQSQDRGRFSDQNSVNDLGSPVAAGQSLRSIEHGHEWYHSANTTQTGHTAGVPWTQERESGLSPWSRSHVTRHHSVSGMNLASTESFSIRQEQESYPGNATVVGQDSPVWYSGQDLITNRILESQQRSHDKKALLLLQGERIEFLRTLVALLTTKLGFPKEKIEVLHLESDRDNKNSDYKLVKGLEWLIKNAGDYSQLFLYIYSEDENGIGLTPTDIQDKVAAKIMCHKSATLHIFIDGARGAPMDYKLVKEKEKRTGNLVGKWSYTGEWKAPKCPFSEKSQVIQICSDRWVYPGVVTCAFIHSVHTGGWMSYTQLLNSMDDIIQKSFSSQGLGDTESYSVQASTSATSNYQSFRGGDTQSSRNEVVYTRGIREPISTVFLGAALGFIGEALIIYIRERLKRGKGSPTTFKDMKNGIVFSSVFWMDGDACLCFKSDLGSITSGAACERSTMQPLHSESIPSNVTAYDGIATGVRGPAPSQYTRGVFSSQYAQHPATDNIRVFDLPTV